MPETLSGPEYDLAVVRTVRDRILAGDWTRGTLLDRRGNKCLLGHMTSFGTLTTAEMLYEFVGNGVGGIGGFNDTHTQAEVIALLDDVEDSLLGEMGVLS